MSRYLYFGIDDNANPVGVVDADMLQLKIYYEARSLNLNDNFTRNLELLTEDGKYNYVAYLLADDNGMSIKFAKYSSKDRVDLIVNEEYSFVL